MALPFLTLLIGKGGPFLFTIFICIICQFALQEYFTIVYHKSRIQSARILAFIGYLTGLLIILSTCKEGFNLVSVLITLNILVGGLMAVLFYKSDKSILEFVALQGLGIIYIPLLLSYLVLIRNGANGVTWIFFLLAMVILGDTGAYYAGTFWGRHKLCPSVSPGKTIEGLAGGLIAIVVSGSLCKHFFFSQLSWSVVILFLVCISFVGPMGDLFQSVIKRTWGVKDSGMLLPGHGGILDRIDALLFAAPVAYFFKEFMI